MTHGLRLISRSIVCLECLQGSAIALVEGSGLVQFGSELPSEATAGLVELGFCSRHLPQNGMEMLGVQHYESQHLKEQ